MAKDYWDQFDVIDDEKTGVSSAIPPDEMIALTNKEANEALKVKDNYWDQFQEVPSEPEIKETSSILKSGLRGAAQGMSFGFADELAGALEAAKDVATTEAGISDLPELYRQRRDESREVYGEAQKANPATYGVSEFLSGFLIPGGAAVKGVKAAKTLGQAAKQGAKIGAGFGALGGAGYSEADIASGDSEELGDFIKDVGTSTAIGTGLGAGISSATHGISKGIKKIKDSDYFKGLKEVKESLGDASITNKNVSKATIEIADKKVGDIFSKFKGVLRSAQKNRSEKIQKIPDKFEIHEEGKDLINLADKLSQRPDQEEMANQVLKKFGPYIKGTEFKPKIIQGEVKTSENILREKANLLNTKAKQNNEDVNYLIEPLYNEEKNIIGHQLKRKIKPDVAKEPSISSEAKLVEKVDLLNNKALQDGEEINYFIQPIKNESDNLIGHQVKKQFVDQDGIEQIVDYGSPVRFKPFEPAQKIGNYIVEDVGKPVAFKQILSKESVKPPNLPPQKHSAEEMILLDSSLEEAISGLPKGSPFKMPLVEFKDRIRDKLNKSLDIDKERGILHNLYKLDDLLTSENFKKVVYQTERSGAAGAESQSIINQAMEIISKIDPEQAAKLDKQADKVRVLLKIRDDVTRPFMEGKSITQLPVELLTGTRRSLVTKGLLKFIPKPKSTDGLTIVKNVADNYMASKGIENNLPNQKLQLDPKRSKLIAKEYDKMAHDPNSPNVKQSYDALIKETMDQYKAILDTGIKIDKIPEGAKNPYKSSDDLLKDIKENNHMWYYPSESGFGGDDVTKIIDHPMLTEIGKSADGKPLLTNDIFRIVHDYFGHAKKAFKFGSKGEENAWNVHRQMYSPEAQKALTTETRGQNSWVNYGPKGESNRKDPSKTVYAEQKAGLLPDWVNKDVTYEQPIRNPSRIPENIIRMTSKASVSDKAQYSLPISNRIAAEAEQTDDMELKMELDRIRQLPTEKQSIEYYKLQQNEKFRKGLAKLKESEK